ncbi:MAG: L-2-amino-thiazoline-4-carboxylic acid hydrolase [Polyangiaceae bacterium]
MTAPMLAARERACLREFDKWVDVLGPEVEKASGSIVAVRDHFRALLGRMPDPGWRAPTMRLFSISGAIYVAVYLALRDRGVDAAGAWAVCESATRTRFTRMKGLERTAASSGMFSAPMQWLTRSLERRSAEHPVGGWVASYVRGARRGDYGVDYHRCAIRDLAVGAGAAEFAPYICNADAIGSELLGWGLTRTETIAQGGKRCDFRFERGGPTRVRLHVISAGPEGRAHEP